MRPSLLVSSALLLTTILAAGCGGSGSSLPAAEFRADGIAPDSGLEVPVGADCLPALEALPEPEHAVSLAGPGWYPINPRNTVIRVGGQPSPPDQIVLAASGQIAYAIYGVGGFDGDSFPTSARLTLADVTGDYFVGFSDYIAGSWRFSGRMVGSATVEIPLVDEYTSPAAYVNPAGRHYFAIVIPDGGGLRVTGVELGVHGGSLGPRPPRNVHVNTGEASVVLLWDASPDDHDPDFAGYTVERAPLLFGDFDPLGPALPLTELFLPDDSGELDEQYRYRIAAVDVSGNRSTWTTVVGGRVTGAAANPVAVLNLPRGPLVGPVNVTFDLSQSFDPEHPGTPSPSIDSFSINFLYGPADMTGASPVMNAVLQPGCYTIAGEVEVTADMRLGATSATLVVYPRWEADPVVVREPDAFTFSRLLQMRMGQLPVSGRPALFGYDFTIPGFAVWQQNAAGGFDLSVLPAYSAWGVGAVVVGSGEPVAFQDGLVAPVALYEDIGLVLADGNSARWLLLEPRSDDAPVAVASDGTSRIWLFYSQDNAGTSELAVTEVLSNNRYVVYPNIDDILDAIDAVYNPATGMIDVAWGWFDGALDRVEYFRWDPVANVIDDETFPEIVVDWAESIDIEVDPNTNRAALVYYSTNDSRNHYRALEPDGVTWSADEIIDNTDQNWTGNLAFGGPDNHPYAYFGLGASPNQQAQLYERDGGWAVRNSVGFAADSAYQVGMFAVPGSADLVVADAAGTGNIYLATLHDDGSETLQPWPQLGTDFLPGTEGQGFELHGAGGADGVHTVWRNWNQFDCRHLLSPDGGTTWLDEGDLPALALSLDLTANGNGEIYCSYVDLMAGNAVMCYWDGLAFANRAVFPCLPLHRPFFSAIPGAPVVHWTMFENVTGNMHYMAGDEIGGYLDNIVLLSDGPVWSGVTHNTWEVLVPMVSIRHLALAGGADPAHGTVGRFNDGAPTMAALYDPYLPEPFFFLSMPETHGRTLAASGYLGLSAPFPTDVAWVAQYALLAPARLESTMVLGEEVTELPIAGGMLNFQPLERDYRRTASAGLGWGMTAVGLVSNLGGTDVTFEWSNFGEWENLPLPAGLEYMTMPELVVGAEGRWHLLYKNYLTDQVMSISTE